MDLALYFLEVASHVQVLNSKRAGKEKEIKN